MATKKANNEPVVEKPDVSAEDKRDEEIRLLKEQIAALMKMQAQSANNVSRYPVDEEPVVVVSRFFSDTILEAPNGSFNVTLKCAKPMVVDFEDMKEILKETTYHHYKKLFEDDLLYFQNEGDYKRFNIKRKIDLSDTSLKRILFLPEKEMLEKMNELTLNRRNQNMIHVITFKVAEMLVKESKPLKGWDYDNRKALEEYLSIKFDQIIAMTGLYDVINNMHLYN